MTALPAEIAAQIPAGYSVRWKPPRAQAIGSDGSWIITHDTIDWSRPVTSPALILPTIREHIAAGSPPRILRLTKAQELERAVREEVARGDALDVVARRHRLEVQGVLRITRTVRHAARPRFEDQPSRIGQPPQPGRVAPGRVHFEPEE
ncbi:hypothetical protein J2Y69_002148 [Microbacterium resistens]|uniref:Uncharacterized protein n=1 Tax=Microbacterium resistens TaxID=156977 RepID=A0ABU1SD93_9MICO|nr:hypothetical protein [Microbacterium resistens]MDR6867544.1 hypothetical protein [Microbacterium resistens]